MKLQSKVVYFILIFLILVGLKLIGISKIANIFLYAKNGSTLNMNSYIVKFPLGHWAYFGESKLAYVLSGITINNLTLGVEIFKLPEHINIYNILKNCQKLKQEEYTTQNLHGTMYICKNNITELLYFQSKDKKIFIRAMDYNSTNVQVIDEYKLILNSIFKQ